MKYNVLIYIKKNELKPVGGPRGYLYNLNEGLKAINENNISFINADSKKEKYHNLYNKIPNIIKQYYREKTRIKSCKLILSDSPKISKYISNEFDIIHFHSTMELYRAKDSLKDYKGKVLLTTHTPKPTHLEIYEDSITTREREKYGEYYKKLEMVDEYAFNRADYIIFPCEEAEEPYYNRWKKYKSIKEKNIHKYKYLLTGVQRQVPKKDRFEVRKAYNIPKDAFVISYVGRHNEVKGYDLLKEIGEEVLKNENIYILVAGNEGPLYRLNKDNWIEVGWTKDPHSIIKASDVFILPNKETYFDLVLLEVLSLGMPVILSKTGGNKYFERFESEKIKYFSTKQEAIEDILELKRIKDKTGNLEAKENEIIYEENFSCEVFAKNYIKLIKEIMGE